MSSALPIASLIEQRTSVLCLTRAELVQRLGYRNISKGLRSLEYVCSGDLSRYPDLLRALPGALEVSRQEIDDAVLDTLATLQAVHDEEMKVADASYRRTFQPHAVILARPAQVFVIALLNAEHLLRINVDLSAPRDTWLAQAVAAIPARVLGFDKPHGIVMNYSPDDAVHFDLATQTTTQLSAAKRIGRASSRMDTASAPI